MFHNSYLSHLLKFKMYLNEAGINDGNRNYDLC